jgi:DNA-binding response OmpR family regulator
MSTHNRKGKILVVDDSPAIIEMVKATLEGEGYEVIVATTGEKALKRAENTMPDLILLDVRMPGMDGFETCRRLKANERTSAIPVIFMTGLTATESKVTGFEVGSVDYVTKPIEIGEILARIRTHMTLRTMQKELQTQNQRLQQEVTERKRAEADLQKTNQELAERTQQLSHTLDHLKATQNQLIESEKMAALGGLVAGVAHEINTPVGVGVTAASMLEDETESAITVYEKGQLKRSELETYLRKVKQTSQLILTNLQRTAELVESFKQVAVGQTSLGKRRFPVKQYLEGTLLGLHPRLKQTNHQVTVIGDDTLIIDSYPGAFSQVVTNLVMNSITHAYRKDAQGHLRFDLTQNQNRLILEYTDDGEGIPAENLSKIFDPFFTTARGQGRIGLGLHIVHNLVTQKLKGKIRCESQVGSGTKFILDLPIQIPGEPPRDE